MPLPLAAVSRLRLVVDIERNAREGEPYRSSIAVRTSDGRPLDITGCAIPPGSGVSYLDGTLTAVEPRPGECVVQSVRPKRRKPGCRGAPNRES